MLRQRPFSQLGTQLLGAQTRAAQAPSLVRRFATPATPSSSNTSPSPRPIPPVDAKAAPGVSQPNPLLSPTLQRYAPRLYALSARTGVPLSSLAVSFLVLHELTAIIPLVLIFWLFQVLGAGAAFVHWIKGDSASTTNSERSEEGGWSWRGMVDNWIEEGEKRVERVGKRYGILGYEKVSKGATTGPPVEGGEAERSLTRSGAGAAGGVANAIAAYVVVKALLPVRIGVSIAAAPAFARFALEPFRRLGLRLGGRRTGAQR